MGLTRVRQFFLYLIPRVVRLRIRVCEGLNLDVLQVESGVTNTAVLERLNQATGPSAELALLNPTVPEIDVRNAAWNCACRGRVSVENTGIYDPGSRFADPPPQWYPPPHPPQAETV